LSNSLTFYFFLTASFLRKGWNPRHMTGPPPGPGAAVPKPRNLKNQSCRFNIHYIRIQIHAFMVSPDSRPDPNRFRTSARELVMTKNWKIILQKKSNFFDQKIDLKFSTYSVASSTPNRTYSSWKHEILSLYTRRSFLPSWTCIRTRIPGYTELITENQIQNTAEIMNDCYPIPVFFAYTETF
jgi:hypothetical protein